MLERFSVCLAAVCFCLEPLALCLWMGRSAKPLSQRLGERKTTNRRRERKKRVRESERGRQRLGAVHVCVHELWSCSFAKI